MASAAAIPRHPLSFLAHYVWRRRWSHASILVAVLVAVSASVGARYSLKFVVDAVSEGQENIDAVWRALHSSWR